MTQPPTRPEPPSRPPSGQFSGQPLASTPAPPDQRDAPPDPWEGIPEVAPQAPHPALNPATEPPEPTTRGARSSKKAVAAALVLGLLVGAAIVGGLWWAGVIPNGKDDAAKPKGPSPVKISATALPEEILGMKRSDLAQPDTDQGKKTAESVINAAESFIPEYKKSYGGDGIDMPYSGGQDRSATLFVVNGFIALPKALSDERITLSKAIAVGLDPGVLAVDESKTRCTVSAKDPVKDETKSPDELRAMVLQSTVGSVRCVTADAARELSVAVNVSVKTGTETLESIAKSIADETTKIYQDRA